MRKNQQTIQLQVVRLQRIRNILFTQSKNKRNSNSQFHVGLTIMCIIKGKSILKKHEYIEKCVYMKSTLIKTSNKFEIIYGEKELSEIKDLLVQAIAQNSKQ